MTRQSRMEEVDAPEVRRAATIARRDELHGQLEAAFITAINTHGGEACRTGNAQVLVPRYAQRAREVFATLGGNDERAVGAPREEVLRDTVAILTYTLGILHAGIDDTLAATKAFVTEVQALAARY